MKTRTKPQPSQRVKISTREATNAILDAIKADPKASAIVAQVIANTRNHPYYDWEAADDEYDADAATDDLNDVVCLGRIVEAFVKAGH